MRGVLIASEHLPLPVFAVSEPDIDEIAAKAETMFAGR